MSHRLPTQPPIPGDDYLRTMADRVEWCRDRLIELSGVDGKNGRIGALLAELERSKQAQGARIGQLESQLEKLSQRLEPIESKYKSITWLWALFGGAITAGIAKLITQWGG